ncbi:SRPBCC family protein [Pedobacter deserti]|uniref:SRPBCC family protein n=1 Tax=Pedobacter deserti TaxID=2817382 RepID=UPI00210954CE|nr:SRPBCC family protein [Pedobacter sp. SYSU D00382]
MESKDKIQVTVQATVAAALGRVWDMWTSPTHIMQWNNASDDWHTPFAEADLRKGGKFRSTMAAKDGSMSFDFEGTYTDLEEHRLIGYEMPDGRKVSVSFTESPAGVQIVETFDAENEHPVDMQRAGWQAILDNFKKYAENH